MQLTNAFLENSGPPSPPRPRSSNPRSTFLWQTQSPQKQTRPANSSRFYSSETLLGPLQEDPSSQILGTYIYFSLLQPGAAVVLVSPYSHFPVEPTYGDKFHLSGPAHFHPGPPILVLETPVS